MDSRQKRTLKTALGWLTLLLAIAGTVALAKDLERRGGNPASSFWSMGSVRNIYLFDGRAEPTSVSVNEGEEVMFVVMDESIHNLAEERTESRRGARLESGEFGEGESYSLTFGKSGAYSFYDRMDPDIRVEITVK